jgi:CheY-like chemotaxis protein
MASAYVWHGGCVSGWAMTRILVIDDDPAIRSVIGDALRQDGYQVDAAANGQQALTAFGKHRPDALVLDLEMPVMDGPTLMRTLRERTKMGQRAAGCRIRHGGRSRDWLSIGRSGVFDQAV